jgi:hypothetical protein
LDDGNFFGRRDVLGELDASFCRFFLKIVSCLVFLYNSLIN